MHMNEQYGGRCLCAWVEMEMHFRRQYKNSLYARVRTMSLAVTMLSDAHHLGVCIQVIAVLSISHPMVIEPEQSHCSSFSRPENQVSRWVSTTAGLIRPLITHSNHTLYSLSTYVCQAVSSLSMPDLDQTLKNRPRPLRRGETRLNSCACDMH